MNVMLHAIFLIPLAYEKVKFECHLSHVQGALLEITTSKIIIIRVQEVSAFQNMGMNTKCTSLMMRALSKNNHLKNSNKMLGQRERERESISKVGVKMPFVKLNGEGAL